MKILTTIQIGISSIVLFFACGHTSDQKEGYLKKQVQAAPNQKILIDEDGNSPWYDLNFGDYLYSAEYTFAKNQLKQF